MAEELNTRMNLVIVIKIEKRYILPMGTLSPSCGTFCRNPGWFPKYNT